MNKIDLQALKENFDLRDIVTADLGTDGKPGGSARLHFCPFHENTRTPALAVWEIGFKCYGCEKTGDIITWLQDYRKLSFEDSVKFLGGTLEGTPRIAPRPKPAPRAKPAPANDWQETAWEILHTCKEMLWHDERGARALAWLQSDARLLTPETIDAWDLGYSPGLKIAGAWVERGIVIPWQSFGEIWRINIRRPKGDPKYRQLKGSRGGIFGIETTNLLKGKFPVFVVEGEFDAMLLWSVVARHDLNAAVITTGGATVRIDPATWGQWFLNGSKFLAAYDTDKAGSAGENALWNQIGGKVTPAPIPEIPDVKDLTDYKRSCGDLLAWAQYHMEHAQ